MLRDQRKAVMPGLGPCSHVSIRVDRKGVDGWDKPLPLRWTEAALQSHAAPKIGYSKIGLSGKRGQDSLVRKSVPISDVERA